MAPICLTGLLHILSRWTQIWLHQIPPISCINPGCKKSCSHMANMSPNVLSWLVFPGVPCAQTASLHPAAELFTQPPTTSPTLVHWYLKEGMPVCFSWHKHKVPLGSFLDPLHAVYHGATKALPADCIKCKGRLWAKPGKRPTAESGAVGI